MEINKIKYFGEAAASYLIEKCKATFALITHKHTAEEVGADASGSASAALALANEYTDEQLSSLSTGDVVVKESEHSSTADTATNAENATNAEHATSADTATTANSAIKAEQDGNGNVIADTYETKADAQVKYDTIVEAKADWNQNDETAKDYVKNRPFYTTAPVETVLFDVVDMQYTGENMYGLVYSIPCEISGFHPVGGDTCDAVVNGVTYSGLIWDDYSNLDIHENMRLHYDEYENVFIITYIPSDINNLNITVKLTTITQTDIQLPEKYISYKPGKIVTGQTFTIDEEEVVAQEGAEIFNNYENNSATGWYSHAEGNRTIATGYCSHAEGSSTGASGRSSHAEGSGSKSSGDYSHAEGGNAQASGDYSHAEGVATQASGDSSHAEGSYTMAIGNASHAEGSGFRYFSMKVSGDAGTTIYSVTDEHGNLFDKSMKYALMSCTFNDGKYRIVDVTVDNEKITHITLNKSFNLDSSVTNNTIAVVVNTSAIGDYSHAEGYCVVASGDYSHAEGKFNLPDDENKYLHIVGNGSGHNNRSNAHTLDWSGNAWFAGDVYTGSTSGTNRDEGSKKLASEEYVDNAVAANEAVFTVNITENEDEEGNITYSADKTFAEIKGAYESGKVIKCVTDFGIGNLVEKYDDSLAFLVCTTDGSGCVYDQYIIDNNNTIYYVCNRISPEYMFKVYFESHLSTTDKTIVGAINELNAKHTEGTDSLILLSPNGTKFTITVGDDGVLTATEITE